MLYFTPGHSQGGAAIVHYIIQNTNTFYSHALIIVIITLFVNLTHTYLETSFATEGPYTSIFDSKSILLGIFILLYVRTLN